MNCVCKREGGGDGEKQPAHRTPLQVRAGQMGRVLGNAAPTDQPEGVNHFIISSALSPLRTVANASPPPPHTSAPSHCPVFTPLLSLPPLVHQHIPVPPHSPSIPLAWLSSLIDLVPSVSRLPLQADIYRDTSFSISCLQPCSLRTFRLIRDKIKTDHSLLEI